MALRRRDREPPLELLFEPGDGAEDTARENEGEGLPDHVEPARHRQRRRLELVGGAAQDADRHRVSLRERPLHALGERSDRRRPQVGVIDLVDQLLCALDAEMLEQERRQRRRGAAMVRLAQHGAQRGAADPVAAPLVAEHVAPPARARRFPLGVAAVGNRTGARDHDHAGLAGRARLQRHQRIVDDEHARLVADALHDPLDDRGIVRTVDPGDAQADGGRANVEAADRLLHHVVEHLLDFELADRLQVGAAAARLGDHRAVLVGQEADGLGAARVNSEYVEHVAVRSPLSAPRCPGPAVRVRAAREPPSRAKKRPAERVPPAFNWNRPRTSAYQYSFRLS